MSQYSVYINHYQASLLEKGKYRSVPAEVRALLEGEHTAVTHAEVYFGNRKTGQKVSEGYSKCLEGDKFRKRLGVKTAVTRALRDAKLTKQQRTELWQRIWHANESASA